MYSVATDDSSGTVKSHWTVVVIIFIIIYRHIHLNMQKVDEMFEEEKSEYPSHSTQADCAWTDKHLILFWMIFMLFFYLFPPYSLPSNILYARFFKLFFVVACHELGSVSLRNFFFFLHILTSCTVHSGVPQHAGKYFPISEGVSPMSLVSHFYISVEGAL